MNFNDIAGECPFAHDSMEKGRILGPIKGNEKVVISMIEKWDDSYDVIIVQPHLWWFDYPQWIEQNEIKNAQKDIILIADANKGFILIQKLSELVETADKLMSQNYYKDHSKAKIDEYYHRIALTQYIYDK